MKKPIFPYYSFIHSKNNSVTKDDTYYNAGNLDWAKLLEDNFEIIQAEILNFISKNEKQFEPYFATEMMNEPNKWQTIGFLFWGLNDESRIKQCPKIFELLKKIPGLISFSINKMEAHSEIKAHYGDTNSIYRCHFPIIVPAQLPDTGFQVGYEERSWEPGKLLIFNDAAYHKGWNKSDKERIILMIDIIRPEYLWQKKWICSLVLSSLLIQKNLKMNFKNKKNPIPYLLLYPLAIYGFYYFSLIKPHLLPYDER